MREFEGRRFKLDSSSNRIFEPLTKKKALRTRGRDLEILELLNAEHLHDNMPKTDNGSEFQKV